MVLAALEVKTETGVLRPGQRNRIRRFREHGIPAGVVRSIEEARQGMQEVKQGTYQMSLDMSFLNKLINQTAGTVEEEAPKLPGSPGDLVEDETEQTPITDVMGMPGTYEEVDAPPAPDEPEDVPTARDEAEDKALGLGAVQPPDALELGYEKPRRGRPKGSTNRSTAWEQPPPSFPNVIPTMGVLEGIVELLTSINDHLGNITGLLESFIDGFQGEDEDESSPPPAEVPTPRRRGRRPKSES